MNESYKQDIKKNNIAKKVYKIIKNNIDSLKLDNYTYNSEVKRGSETKPMEFYGVAFNLSTLVPNYNLTIAFLHRPRGLTTDGFFSKKHNLLAFFILESPYFNRFWGDDENPQKKLDRQAEVIDIICNGEYGYTYVNDEENKVFICVGDSHPLDMDFWINIFFKGAIAKNYKAEKDIEVTK